LGTFSRYIATTLVNRGESAFSARYLLRDKSATSKTLPPMTLIERINTDRFVNGGRLAWFRKHGSASHLLWFFSHKITYPIFKEPFQATPGGAGWRLAEKNSECKQWCHYAATTAALWYHYAAVFSS
jgi:hypothetical protein